MSVPWVWWIVRVSGLVGFWAMWLSLLFGVSLAGRGGGHPPTLARLHTPWAWVGFVASLGHALAAGFAPEGGVPTLAVLVPMVSPVARGAITLGTLALWGVGGLVLSSALRSRLGARAWRSLHTTAIGVGALGWAHAWAVGTDLELGLVRGAFVAAAAVLGGAILQRVLLAAFPAAGRRASEGRDRTSPG